MNLTCTNLYQPVPPCRISENYGEYSHHQNACERRRKTKMKKMSLGGKVMLVGAILCAVGIAMGVNGGDSNTAGMLTMASAYIMLYGFIGWLIGRARRKKKAAYEALSPEEKAAYDAKKEEEARVIAQFCEQERARAAEDRAQGKIIVSTAIVDSTAKSKTKASATSSVVRGAVGGALFGGVGMVVGAVTPKKKTITKNKDVTFAILYANGKRDLEKVKVGSKRYNELAKYLA